MGKTLVLGMGNTIRGDDGVGIKIIEALKGQLDSSAVEIKQTHESGINLLDKIAGYEKVIIIDSIKSESGMIGDIYRLNPLWYRKVYRCLLIPEGDRPSYHLRKGLTTENRRGLSPKAIFLEKWPDAPGMPYSLHNIGLPEVLKLTGGLIDTPKEVIIYAVNIGDNGSYSDKLTLKIKRAIPKTVELVKKELAS